MHNENYNKSPSIDEKEIEVTEYVPEETLESIKNEFNYDTGNDDISDDRIPPEFQPFYKIMKFADNPMFRRKIGKPGKFSILPSEQASGAKHLLVVDERETCSALFVPVEDLSPLWIGSGSTNIIYNTPSNRDMNCVVSATDSMENSFILQTSKSKKSTRILNIAHEMDMHDRERETKKLSSRPSENVFRRNVKREIVNDELSFDIQEHCPITDCTDLEVEASETHFSKYVQLKSSTIVHMDDKIRFSPKGEFKIGRKLRQKKLQHFIIVDEKETCPAQFVPETELITIWKDMVQWSAPHLVKETSDIIDCTEPEFCTDFILRYHSDQPIKMSQNPNFRRRIREKPIFRQDKRKSDYEFACKLRKSISNRIRKWLAEQPSVTKLNHIDNIDESQSEDFHSVNSNAVSNERTNLSDFSDMIEQELKSNPSSYSKNHHKHEKKKLNLTSTKSKYRLLKSSVDDTSTSLSSAINTEIVVANCVPLTKWEQALFGPSPGTSVNSSETKKPDSSNITLNDADTIKSELLSNFDINENGIFGILDSKACINAHNENRPSSIMKTIRFKDHDGDQQCSSSHVKTQSDTVKVMNVVVEMGGTLPDNIYKKKVVSFDSFGNSEGDMPPAILKEETNSPEVDELKVVSSHNLILEEEPDKMQEITEEKTPTLKECEANSEQLIANHTDFDNVEEVFEDASEKTASELQLLSDLNDLGHMLIRKNTSLEVLKTDSVTRAKSTEEDSTINMNYKSRKKRSADLRDLHDVVHKILSNVGEINVNYIEQLNNIEYNLNNIEENLSTIKDNLLKNSNVDETILNELHRNILLIENSKSYIQYAKEVKPRMKNCSGNWNFKANSEAQTILMNLTESQLDREDAAANCSVVSCTRSSSTEHSTVKNLVARCYDSEEGVCVEENNVPQNIQEEVFCNDLEIVENTVEQEDHPVELNLKENIIADTEIKGDINEDDSADELTWNSLEQNVSSDPNIADLSNSNPPSSVIHEAALHISSQNMFCDFSGVGENELPDDDINLQNVSNQNVVNDYSFRNNENFCDADYVDNGGQMNNQEGSISVNNVGQNNMYDSNVFKSAKNPNITALQTGNLGNANQRKHVRSSEEVQNSKNDWKKNQKKHTEENNMLLPKEELLNQYLSGQNLQTGFNSEVSNKRNHTEQHNSFLANHIKYATFQNPNNHNISNELRNLNTSVLSNDVPVNNQYATVIQNANWERKTYLNNVEMQNTYNIEKNKLHLPKNVDYQCSFNKTKIQDRASLKNIMNCNNPQVDDNRSRSQANFKQTKPYVRERCNDLEGNYRHAVEREGNIQYSNQFIDYDASKNIVIDLVASEGTYQQNYNEIISDSLNYNGIQEDNESFPPNCNSHQYQNSVAQESINLPNENHFENTHSVNYYMLNDEAGADMVNHNGRINDSVNYYARHGEDNESYQNSNNRLHQNGLAQESIQIKPNVNQLGHSHSVNYCRSNNETGVDVVNRNGRISDSGNYNAMQGENNESYQNSNNRLCQNSLAQESTIEPNVNQLESTQSANYYTSNDEANIDVGNRNGKFSDSVSYNAVHGEDNESYQNCNHNVYQNGLAQDSTSIKANVNQLGNSHSVNYFRSNNEAGVDIENPNGRINDSINYNARLGEENKFYQHFNNNLYQNDLAQDSTRIEANVNQLGNSHSVNYCRSNNEAVRVDIVNRNGRISDSINYNSGLGEENESYQNFKNNQYQNDFARESARSEPNVNERGNSHSVNHYRSNNEAAVDVVNRIGRMNDSVNYNAMYGEDNESYQNCNNHLYQNGAQESIRIEPNVNQLGNSHSVNHYRSNNEAGVHVHGRMNDSVNYNPMYGEDNESYQNYNNHLYQNGLAEESTRIQTSVTQLGNSHSVNCYRSNNESGIDAVNRNGRFSDSINCNAMPGEENDSYQNCNNHLHQNGLVQESTRSEPNVNELGKSHSVNHYRSNNEAGIDVAKHNERISDSINYNGIHGEDHESFQNFNNHLYQNGLAQESTRIEPNINQLKNTHSLNQYRSNDQSGVDIVNNNERINDTINYNAMHEAHNEFYQNWDNHLYQNGLTQESTKIEPAVNQLGNTHSANYCRSNNEADVDLMNRNERIRDSVNYNENQGEDNESYQNCNNHPYQNPLVQESARIEPNVHQLENTNSVNNYRPNDEAVIDGSYCTEINNGNQVDQYINEFISNEIDANYSNIVNNSLKELQVPCQYAEEIVNESIKSNLSAYNDMTNKYIKRNNLSNMLDEGPSVTELLYEYYSSSAELMQTHHMESTNLNNDLANEPYLDESNVKVEQNDLLSSLYQNGLVTDDSDSRYLTEEISKINQNELPIIENYQQDSGSISQSGMGEQHSKDIINETVITTGIREDPPVIELSDQYYSTESMYANHMKSTYKNYELANEEEPYLVESDLLSSLYESGLVADDSDSRYLSEEICKMNQSVYSINSLTQNEVPLCDNYNRDSGNISQSGLEEQHSKDIINETLLTTQVCEEESETASSFNRKSLDDSFLSIQKILNDNFNINLNVLEFLKPMFNPPHDQSEITNINDSKTSPATSPGDTFLSQFPIDDALKKIVQTVDLSIEGKEKFSPAHLEKLIKLATEDMEGEMVPKTKCNNDGTNIEEDIDKKPCEEKLNIQTIKKLLDEMYIENSEIDTKSKTIVDQYVNLVVADPSTFVNVQMEPSYQNMDCKSSSHLNNYGSSESSSSADAKESDERRTNQAIVIQPLVIKSDEPVLPKETEAVDAKKVDYESTPIKKVTVRNTTDYLDIPGRNLEESDSDDNIETDETLEMTEDQEHLEKIIGNNFKLIKDAVEEATTRQSKEEVYVTLVVSNTGKTPLALKVGPQIIDVNIKKILSHVCEGNVSDTFSCKFCQESKPKDEPSAEEEEKEEDEEESESDEDEIEETGSADDVVEPESVDEASIGEVEKEVQDDGVLIPDNISQREEEIVGFSTLATTLGSDESNTSDKVINVMNIASYTHFGKNTVCVMRAKSVNPVDASLSEIITIDDLTKAPRKESENEAVSSDNSTDVVDGSSSQESASKSEMETSENEDTQSNRVSTDSIFATDPSLISINSKDEYQSEFKSCDNLFANNNAEQEARSRKLDKILTAYDMIIKAVENAKDTVDETKATNKYNMDEELSPTDTEDEQNDTETESRTCKSIVPYSSDTDDDDMCNSSSTIHMMSHTKVYKIGEWGGRLNPIQNILMAFSKKPVSQFPSNHAQEESETSEHSIHSDMCADSSTEGFDTLTTDEEEELARSEDESEKIKLEIIPSNASSNITVIENKHLDVVQDDYPALPITLQSEEDVTKENRKVKKNGRLKLGDLILQRLETDCNIDESAACSTSSNATKSSKKFLRMDTHKRLLKKSNKETNNLHSIDENTEDSSSDKKQGNFMSRFFKKHKVTKP